MILDILTDSMKYSTQNWKILSKLGIISFFSLFIVPIFLIYGYEYRVIRESIDGVINGKDKLPPLENKKSMLKDGVKVVIVKLIYFLIPVIIFILSTSFMEYFGELELMILLIISIMFLILSEVSICNMALHEGSLKKAFNLKGIFQKIDAFGLLKLIFGLLIIHLVIITAAVLVISIIFNIVLNYGIIGPYFWFLTIILTIIPSFGDPSIISGTLQIWDIILISAIEFAILKLITKPFLSILTGRSFGLLCER